MEQKDVFISHHEDSAGPLAAQIANALESVEISCWYAPRDIKTQDFRNEISSAIHNCKVFLLLVNPQVEHRPEIRAECEQAYEFYKQNPEQPPLEIRIFRINGCPLPLNLYHFKIFQHVDSDIPTLVHQIAQILNVELQTTPKAPQPVPPTQDQPSTKIIKSGYCGPHATYKLDETGVLTISGSGPMWDFTNKRDMPWWDVREEVSHVEIEYGICYIGYRAFDYCTGLRSVTIPKSVTEIGDWAFHSCVWLKAIIADSITSIGKHAFSSCMRLTSVTIPDSVTEIGDCAFWYCRGLKSVIIPNNVTEIESSTFQGCSGLKSIAIPESVTKIAGSAFRYCENLTNVSIPDSVISIESFAFWGCTSLTSVSFSEKVRRGLFAFPFGVRIERRP